MLNKYYDCMSYSFLEYCGSVLIFVALGVVIINV